MFSKSLILTVLVRTDPKLLPVMLERFLKEKPRKKNAKHILSGANSDPKNAKNQCGGVGRGSTSSRIFCQNNVRHTTGKK